MTQDGIITLVQQALLATILVSAPPLVIGLLVGVAVSIFQTITSIQEPTLAFIPKILAVLISIVVFGSFMLTTMEELFFSIYSNIPQFIIPR